MSYNKFRLNKKPVSQKNTLKRMSESKDIQLLYGLENPPAGQLYGYQNDPTSTNGLTVIVKPLIKPRKIYW